MDLCIVITLFNVEKFAYNLNRSIDYDHVSVVVIDDKSSDHSSSYFPKVHTLSDKHPSGVAYAANWGMQHCPAVSKFIAFIDGDDWIEKTYISKMLQTIKRTNADVVVAQYNSWDENDNALPLPKSEMRFWRECTVEVFNVSHPCFETFSRINPLPGRRIHRREKLPYFVEGYARFEDNVQFWDIMFQKPRIATLGCAVYNHRSSRTLKTQVESLAEFVWHTAYLQDKYQSTFLTPYIKTWISGLSWIAKKQNDVRNKRLLNEQLVMRNTFTVSLIIPCLNVNKWIATLLKNVEMFVQVLESKQMSTQVIFSHGNSNDGTAAAIKAYSLVRRHALLLQYKGKNAFAGILRNFAIPFAQGKWCIFFDADDEIFPLPWASAIQKATAEGADLAFVRYEQNIEDASGAWSRKGMHAPDENIWRHFDLQSSYDFVNYPWTRVVRTDLILSQLIHFGINYVHNDIVYHWLSLSYVKHIVAVNQTGLSHRYHYQKNQLTASLSPKREFVNSDIRLIHRRLCRLRSWLSIKQHFHAFVIKIIKWITGNFNVSLNFCHESRFTLDCVQKDYWWSCVK